MFAFFSNFSLAKSEVALRLALSIGVFLKEIIRITLSIRFLGREGFGDYLLKNLYNIFNGRSLSSLSEKLSHLEELAFANEFIHDEKTYLGKQYTYFTKWHADPNWDKEFLKEEFILYYLKDILTNYSLEEIKKYDVRVTNNKKIISKFRKQLHNHENTSDRTDINKKIHNFFKDYSDRDLGLFFSTLLKYRLYYAKRSESSEQATNYLKNNWNDTQQATEKEIEDLLKKYSYGENGYYVGPSQLGANIRAIIAASNIKENNQERRELRLLITLLEETPSIATRIAVIVSRLDVLDELQKDLWKMDLEKLHKLTMSIKATENNLKEFSKAVEKAADQKEAGIAEKIFKFYEKAR